MTTTTTRPAPPRLSVQDTELAAIHSDAGIIGETLASIPAWRTVADALTALAASPRPVPPGDPADIVKAHLLDAVRNGSSVPDDLPEVAAKAAGAASAFAALVAGRDNARRELAADLDAALRGHWSTLFEALNAELGAIVEAARTLAPLEDLTDAETAVRADRVPDYQAYRALLSRYAAVRTAQSRLARHSDALAEVTHAEVMFIAAPDSAFPDWAAWRTTGHKVDPRTKQRIRLSPPWPCDPSGRLTVSDAGSPEFLRWILTSRARAWVPTPHQMREESARLDALMQDSRSNAPSRKVKAIR